MDALERTRDLFERNERYRQPPVIAFADLGDPDVLRRFGIGSGLLASTIARAGFALSGLSRFARSRPEQIEATLRRTESRVMAFPPVVSATIVLRDDDRPLSMEERAATLILGARSLFEDVMSGALPQDETRGAPLEMGQYPNLFSTSLVIEGTRFRTRKSRDASTIAISVRDELYTLAPWAGNATPASAEFVRSLREVVDASSTAAGSREPPVGILTAARDALQFRFFAELARNAGHRASLDALKNVFFTVCLEPDTHPASAAEAASLAQSGHLSNRWHHSSLQIVVFGNGVAAVFCSFRAWLDGNAMVRGAAEIQRRACAVPTETAVSTPTPIAPHRKLTWRVDPRLIEEATADVRGVLDDDPLSTFEIPDVGKRQLGARGLGAIPVFVVALAWTMHRMTGRVPAIKQFLSLAKYRCMGIGLGSVTTPEVGACVEYLERGAPDPAQFLILLTAAARSEERECSAARNAIQLEELRHLFHQTQTRAARAVSTASERVALAILRRLGRYTPAPRDILISHPAQHAEVVAAGRPGVRLPYVGCFAMHYSIEPGRIKATIGRSAYWNTPNATLVTELTQSVVRIAALMGHANPSAQRDSRPTA